ncbi:MAG: hypothetical protein BWK78_05910 [Thiotrichaceae bacterium IS1]|nr:MAG: hypothetical protein BWK78_05910 [Thiotrichaceae bacterium IS1]
MNAKDYMQKKKGKKRQKDVRKSPAKKGAADYLNLGVDDVERGKLEQALVNYNKAIALNPNIAEAYYNRGTLYLMQNQSNQALEDLEQAIRLNPGYAKAYCHRGTLYLGQDQFNRALADFNQAIDLNSKYLECYANRGTLYLKQNQFVLALNDLDKAVEFADSKAQKQHLCLLISLNYTMAKAFDQARKYVEKAFDGFLDWSQSQHKQTCLDNINLTEELYRRNAELEQTNQQLQKTQDRLQKLVSDYNHTLGSKMRPAKLSQLAEQFRKVPEFQESAMMLEDAYYAEIFILNQSKLLQLKHGMQNPEDIRAEIRDSICRDNSLPLETATDFQSIFNNVLHLLTRDFLDDKYVKLSVVREQVLSRLPITLVALQRDFRLQIMEEQKNLITWVHNNLLPIQLQWSPTWEQMKLKKAGCAETLLHSYLTELFLNVFKYSDYQWFKITFEEEILQGSPYLVSTWENSYNDNHSISTGSGLNGIREELKILNDSQAEETTLQVINDQEQRLFRVRLALKQDLLIYKTEPRQSPRLRKRA